MVIFLLLVIIALIIAPNLVMFVAVLSAASVAAITVIFAVIMLLGELISPQLEVVVEYLLTALLLALASWCAAEWLYLIVDAIYTQSRRLKRWWFNHQSV